MQWRVCYTLGGDGNGGSNFATTIVVVSLPSLVSATQKEERKNIKQRGTNRDKKKFAMGCLQETRKKGSNSISV